VLTRRILPRKSHVRRGAVASNNGQKNWPWWTRISADVQYCPAPGFDGWRVDGHGDFRCGRTARTSTALAQHALVPGGDCSVADRFHGRCNSGTNFSGVWTFQLRFCAARKIEDFPELLFDVLLLFNPLFQSPAIGARHGGTNASHCFAPYDFVSHLPEKFRALSTELLVWWGGRKMGRHGKHECLKWMGQECSQEHSVDTNVDLQVVLRIYYMSTGTDIHRHSTGERLVFSS